MTSPNGHAKGGWPFVKLKGHVIYMPGMVPPSQVPSHGRNAGALGWILYKYINAKKTPCGRIGLYS